MASTAGVGSGRVIGVAIAAAIAAFLLFQAAFRSWRYTAGFASSCLARRRRRHGAGAEEVRSEILGLLAILGLAARFAVACQRCAIPPGLTASRTSGSLQQAVGSGSGRSAPVSVALALLVLPAVILGDRPGLEILRMALILRPGWSHSGCESAGCARTVWGSAPPSGGSDGFAGLGRSGTQRQQRQRWG